MRKSWPIVAGYLFLWLAFFTVAANAQGWNEPPPCQNFLYCQLVGKTIGDPACWCHWQDQWRAPTPPPPWWYRRHQSRPQWQHQNRRSEWRRRNDGDRGGDNNRRR